MIVRPEEPEDRGPALEVERSAFGSDEEPAIVEALRDGAGSFALVAEVAGEVVGHVQFSRAWVGETEALALGPMAVRPDRQGKGIGAALVRGGLEVAAERGETTVIVVGDAGYYERFGFRPASSFGVPVPFPEVPEDDFMLAHLGGEGSAPTGAVRYHPAFGQAG